MRRAGPFRAPKVLTDVKLLERAALAREDGPVVTHHRVFGVAMVQLLLVGYISANAGSLQIEASTVVAVVGSRDFVVAATDSRTKNGEETQKCRLRPLGEHAFFIGNGVTEIHGDTPADVLYSAEEEAKQQYGSDRPLNNTVETWASITETKFDKLSPLRKTELHAAADELDIPGRIVTQGIFARDDGSNVEIWEAGVTFVPKEDEQFSFSHGPPHQLENNVAEIHLWGTRRTVLRIVELWNGKTLNSSKWQTHIDQQAQEKGYSEADARAFELKSDIEYLIRTGIDPTIGGEVATLILESNQPLRWFNRPSVCAQ